MSPKQIVFASFLTVIIFSACKKNNYQVNAPVTTTTTSNKPKTYTEDVLSGSLHTTETFNLSFDASGRIVSAIATAPNAGDKFLWQYNTNNSFTIDIYGANVLSIHELCWVNSNNLLDSTYQYNSTQDTSTEKYVYDANKLLVKLLEYNYKKATGSTLINTTNYTHDAKGNVISEVSAGLNFTYTYSSAPYDPILSLLEPPYTALPKNMVATSSNNSGGVITNETYTYTYDAQGRLLTEKIVGSGGNTYTITKTFTY